MQYLTSRVIDLRNLLQLSQTELAATIDIDASYISKLEKGTRPLTREVVERFALRHHLPFSFFTAEDPITNVAAPTFRKKATTTLREERYVHTLQKLAMRLFHRVSLDTNYTPWSHPVPISTSDPEVAAELTREHFGLTPLEPVRNVTRLLERSGVGVINSLDPSGNAQLAARYHGVSRPNSNDDRPLVALFDTGRGEVNRLTAAHELGHLILDRTPDTLLPREREARAFRFAGAFLLPPAVVSNWITPELALSGYVAIKAQYGISISAAIRRGFDLGLIDHDRYRSLMIQHSSRGWRYDEPGHVEKEEAILLRQAVERSSTNPTRPVSNAAGLTGVPLAHISHWTGLTDKPTPPQQNTTTIIDLAAARAQRAA